MTKLPHIARATRASAIARLVTTTLSAAQDAERTLKPKPRVATQKQVVTKPEKPAAAAQTNKSSRSRRSPGEKGAPPDPAGEQQ